MTPAAAERSRVRLPLWLAGAAAWVLVATGGGGWSLASFCSVQAWTSPSLAAMETALALNPPADLTGAWLLMIVAMMAPLLPPTIGHVRSRSLPQRRPRAIALFLAGYLTIWMSAGLVLVGIALAIRLSFPAAYMAPALALLLALIWQVSPLKQRFLNACHALPNLAAFGWAADRDALLYGLTHGRQCFGNCWALMLLPLLFGEYHVAAMAIVTVFLSAERLERPALPSWRLRWPSKASRLFLAQARQHIGSR